jgi:hypothetical protein
MDNAGARSFLWTPENISVRPGHPGYFRKLGTQCGYLPDMADETVRIERTFRVVIRQNAATHIRIGQTQRRQGFEVFILEHHKVDSFRASHEIVEGFRAARWFLDRETGFVQDEMKEWALPEIAFHDKQAYHAASLGSLINFGFLIHHEVRAKLAFLIQIQRATSASFPRKVSRSTPERDFRPALNSARHFWMLIHFWAHLKPAGFQKSNRRARCANSGEHEVGLLTAALLLPCRPNGKALSQSPA